MRTPSVREASGASEATAGALGPNARRADATRIEAPVLEVFASFQGEGAHVGEPQTFVRLRGCPLRCRFCDTPGSWPTGSESPAGARARIAAPDSVRREPSVATPFQVACWIASVEPGAPRTVSITGGEPLLWPAFVRALAGLVGPRRVHLETAGAHPDALARTIDVVDHVSLDLKLPDDLDPPVATAGEAGVDAPPVSAGDWRRARRRSLALVASHDACAKLVVTGDAPLEACDELWADLAELAPRVPLVLQPVSPRAGVAPASTERLTALCERARARGLAPRVVPQVHRALGLP